MKIRLLTTSTAMFGLVGLFASHAHAQSADEQDNSYVVDEIIVTAQKRSENMQKVGISITSLSAETLKSMNIITAVDVVSQVPSLQSSQVGLMVTNYAIRGVSQNDFADHLEGPVALYIDDAYLSTIGVGSQPLFDIQRVEVLRGPQGTLFGRNATGGLIRFVTTPPSMENEGYIKVALGSYNWTRVEGAVGGPVTDNLQMRIAGDFSKKNGYIKNLPSEEYNVSGGPALGGIGYRAGRVSLAWQPTSNLDVTLQGRYTHIFEGSGSPYTFTAPTVPDENGVGRFVRPDEDAWGTGPGCGPAPILCFRGPGGNKSHLNTSGRYQSKWYGGTLKMDLDLGNLTLTSVTDYQHFWKDFLEDADGTPFEIVTDDHSSTISQFSQELRGVYASGPLSITAGVNYLQYDVNNHVYFEIFKDYRTDTNVWVDNKSYAAFGHMEYEVTPSLKLIGGIRYTKDKKEAEYILTDNVGTPAFVFNPITQPALAKPSYDLISGKAMAQWQANSDLMLYASYSRGTKSGGFTFPGFFPVDPSVINHKSETLHAYELGSKAQILDGRANLNLSAFYYDYNDYQAYFFVNVPNGFVGTIGNLDARDYGFEAELGTSPFEGLKLNLGASLLRSKVFDVTLPNGNVADRRLPQAPKLALNVLARYEHPIGNTNFVLSEQFDMNYKGGHGLSVLAGETEYEPSYAVGNAQVALATVDRRWEFAVFVRNMWNERYHNFAADLSVFGTVAAGVAPPRTVGASLAFNF